VQDWFVAVVHERVVQFVTAPHGEQTRFAPGKHTALSYSCAAQPTEQGMHALPARYFVGSHCEQIVFAGVVHVSLAQLVMCVHAEHTRSVMPPHTALWYWPAAHPTEHGTHALPCRKSPPAHAVQIWSVVFVHVSLVQPGMTVQLVHARSVVAVHAALCDCPAGQAPEQASHVVPFKKNVGAQLVHAASKAFVQTSFAHPTSGAQLVQARSAVPPHAPLSYWPATHALLHGTHALPWR